MKATFTVEEACSRACPIALASVQVPITCRGDRCMAWRWMQSYDEGQSVSPSTKGFCGLAGSPLPTGV